MPHPYWCHLVFLCVNKTCVSFHSDQPHSKSNIKKKQNKKKTRSAPPASVLLVHGWVCFHFRKEFRSRFPLTSAVFGLGFFEGPTSLCPQLWVIYHHQKTFSPTIWIFFPLVFNLLATKRTLPSVLSNYTCTSVQCHLENYTIKTPCFFKLFFKSSSPCHRWIKRDFLIMLNV